MWSLSRSKMIDLEVSTGIDHHQTTSNSLLLTIHEDVAIETTTVSTQNPTITITILQINLTPEVEEAILIKIHTQNLVIMTPEISRITKKIRWVNIVAKTLHPNKTVQTQLTTTPHPKGIKDNPNTLLFNPQAKEIVMNSLQHRWSKKTLLLSSKRKRRMKETAFSLKSRQIAVLTRRTPNSTSIRTSISLRSCKPKSTTLIGVSKNKDINLMRQECPSTDPFLSPTEVQSKYQLNNKLSSTRKSRKNSASWRNKRESLQLPITTWNNNQLLLNRKICSSRSRTKHSKRPRA
jgi:hypothetical protein